MGRWGHGYNARIKNMNKIYGFDGEVGHGYKVRIKNMNKIHGFDGGVRAWLQCAD